MYIIIYICVRIWMVEYGGLICHFHSHQPCQSDCSHITQGPSLAAVHHLSQTWWPRLELTVCHSNLFNSMYSLFISINAWLLMLFIGFGRTNLKRVSEQSIQNHVVRHLVNHHKTDVPYVRYHSGNNRLLGLCCMKFLNPVNHSWIVLSQVGLTYQLWQQ